jgi:hypothetical protein
VFGAGAGEAAADSENTGGAPPADEPEPSGEPAPTAEPPAGDGGSDNPARDQAVGQINAALQALADAQRNADFEGIGRAQADLQAAVQAYQSAVGQAAASPTG